MFLSITCFSNISASLLSRESYVTFHHEPFILLYQYFPLEILSVLSENKKLIPPEISFLVSFAREISLRESKCFPETGKLPGGFDLWRSIVFLEDPRFRRGEEETGTHRGGGEGRCLPEGSEKVVHGSSTRARVSTRSAVMIRAGAALKRCT